jgi:uncharacterized protein YxeA
MLKGRTTVVIGCVLVIVVVAVWAGSRSATVDRFAPWRSEETGYVMIAPGARAVRDVRLVQPSGRLLNYRVSFTAWGEPRRFVAVAHRGRFVRSIRYVSEDRLPKLAMQTLRALATPGYRDNG